MFMTLPICQYPTTTVLIDDDSLFLKTVTPRVAATALIRSFDKPLEALNYLNQYSYVDILKEKYIHILEPDNLNEVRTSIEYGKIHNELNNTKKYENISTLIIDYDMPEIDGLRLCEMLNEQKIMCSKVLLTSNADDSQIINAFNKGIIDAYIPKHADDLIKSINKVIKKSEQTFFKNISLPITEALLLDRKNPCYLANSQYVKFFQEYIEKKGISEYYLIESIGSYLYKTKDGMVGKIFISDEDGFESVLESLPDQVDKVLINLIEKRNKMVCFDNIGNADVLDDFFIHDCSPIPDSNGLYYSVVSSKSSVL